LALTLQTVTHTLFQVVPCCGWMERSWRGWV